MFSIPVQLWLISLLCSQNLYYVHFFKQLYFFIRMNLMGAIGKKIRAN